jgi:hypothetical protein
MLEAMKRLGLEGGCISGGSSANDGGPKFRGAGHPGLWNRPGDRIDPPRAE